MKALLPSLLITGALHATDMSFELFSERSTPGGKTLFTEVSAKQSGIETTNRYDDPRMWGVLHREYALGAIGTGVAIGDYDKDGRPDVFIVSKMESGRLFRNLGDWRFKDVTVATGLNDDSGEWKQGAAFADVDNDGLLDLYVCYFRAPNRLYINQGNGVFREEAASRGVAVVDGSGMACFADYDGDGFLDFYLQTNLKDTSSSPDGQRDYLFRNNGDGTFEDVTDKAGVLELVTQGHSATWWDYDEDGWLDLYVANDFGPADFLYRNNGDGTFSNVIDSVLPHIPFSSMGADVGDVDNDGRIDFFVADMAGTTVEKEHRGQSDSRALLDAARNERTDGALQIHFNALYLNAGVERCLEAAALAGLRATDWTWAPRFEDLNHDGLLDLFVTNGMDREQNNLDLIEKRMASLNAMGRIGIMKSSPVLREANLAYVNRGDLLFEEVGRKWGLDKFGVSFGSAFGDLDGDGDLDIIVSNYQEGATVLRNDGQEGNSLIVSLEGTRSNKYGLGARIEVNTRMGVQVRQLVSARGYLSTSEPIAHFGLGDVQTIEQLTVCWPSGTKQVFANLETGRRYSIREPEEGEMELGNVPDRQVAQFQEVTGSFGLEITQREEFLEGTVSQPLLPRRFNRRGPGIAVGDLNLDGEDEIVFAATAVDRTKILSRRDANAAYAIVDSEATQELPPINDGPPLVFDANGDGANDLLLTAGGAALPAEEPEYEPRLWLNDGDGGFSSAPVGMLPSLPISVGVAVSADFDRDGKLDLFLGGRLLPGFYPEPAYSALLFQGSEGFSDKTDSFAPELAEVGLVASALASDVDNDGWIDLLVALEWGGVRCYRNEEGRSFEDVSEKWGFSSAGFGLWTSLASADFNQDGRMDYAVGNQGLNTIYKATSKHPMRLFSGDFSDSGAPQLVLAYDVDGSMYPVASRGELSARIPSVRRRFPSNNQFAASILEDILGGEALARSEVYEAGELRSGVLLSQAEGGYVFQPLPRRAQISPIQGMVAQDFNGDGRSDLLFVGNDYSPIPAHGRFDCGLGQLLRGDGEGGFNPAPLDQSGWVIGGNAKALAVVDFNKDATPDLLVSRNNQESLAFLNRSLGGRSLAIQLRGKAGNPDGIGSRVELVSEGRTLQVWEVSAGGGFASQSSATIFMTIPEEFVRDAELKVRWPTGATTTVDAPQVGGYLRVNEEDVR